MDYTDITVEHVEHWLEIGINRPDKMNALRERTAEEILNALETAEHDRQVRTVIFTGSAKAFCTGIDTSEFQLKENEYFDFFRKRKRNRKVNQLFREISQYTKPVISAVEGLALGGGFELALVGDLIVAGAEAQFALPEVRLGLMPGGGGTQTLARLVGPSITKELVWTGRRVRAEEAHALRIVNYVADAGGALERARMLARDISANAPVSVMLTKSSIDRGMDVPLSEGMDIESDVSFMLYFSTDRNEGLQALREKRKPNFKGE
ncbi:enoyl-CoA hydratase/isomerase family protein [Paraburkholderia fungorum]|uniref:enoyl-CoA hydratase/isomerase family protein n=1 Tax=Paraburkholderia fungorum TaxID=134537 RepID=UPI0038B87253